MDEDEGYFNSYLTNSIEHNEVSQKIFNILRFMATDSHEHWKTHN